MILEYLYFRTKGAKIVEWGDKKTGDIKRRFLFKPQCEVPDELGNKMLEKLGKEFKLAGEETPANIKLKCDFCEFIGKSDLSLKVHTKKQHKEKMQ
jgi:hypothetical protein